MDIDQRPPMSEAMRKELADYLREEIETLEVLTGRDLKWRWL